MKVKHDKSVRVFCFCNILYAIVSVHTPSYNIEEVVAQQQLSSPAIIVIGEVVKESSKFHSFYKSVHSELLK